MEPANSDQVAEELRAIKTLLILQVLAAGFQQNHIAAALGVSEATLSRSLPKGFSKIATKVAGRRTSSKDNGS